MKKGYDPIVALADDGQIAGVALGADACSEHEWGVKELKRRFCSKYVHFDVLKEQYRKTAVKPVVDHKSMNRLDQNLETLRSFETDGVFTVSTLWNEESEHIRKIEPRVSRQRSMSTYRLDVEEREKFHNQIVTEWDGQNFRFCNAVWGEEKLIKKLRAFYDQLKAGNGAFFSVHCGIFPKAGKLASGLVVVDVTKLKYFQDNYWKVMDSETSDKLELQFRSRIPVFSKDLWGEDSDGYTEVGYFWPEWHDKKAKLALVYGLNPNYEVNADHFGPYTEAQIRRWHAHGMRYRLRRDSPE